MHGRRRCFLMDRPSDFSVARSLFVRDRSAWDVRVREKCSGRHVSCWAIGRRTQMPVRQGGPAVDVKKIRPQDDGNAFLPDPRETGQSRTRDDLAESLAEEFLEAATSAEE